LEKTTGILFGLEATMRTKLIAIGATSLEKAVTSQEAHFNQQELNWMDYIAGGMFSMIKKTRNKRFYVVI
jgi:hypothetical protein